MRSYQFGNIIQDKSGKMFLYLQNYDIYSKKTNEFIGNYQPAQAKNYIYIPIKSRPEVIGNNIFIDEPHIFLPYKNKKKTERVIEDLNIFGSEILNLHFKDGEFTAKNSNINASIEEIKLLKRIDKSNYFEILKLIKNLFNVVFDFAYDENSKKYINKISYMNIKMKEVSFQEIEFVNNILPYLISLIFVNEYERTISVHTLSYQVSMGAKLTLKNFNQELMFYINKVIEENNNTIKKL